MADCKRKTANLFSDKLIGMTWWDGVITADERFTLYIAEVKPNTEYTASGNNSVDNIMVTYYSVYPAEGQSSVESVRYVYPTNPTRSVAAFTTPDDSRIKYAAVRFGSDATDVMFNLGSTAFPYEPNGWVHSLRKLSTDTDTITTLPAVIYPNDTTATVGLKGQTVQSSTPSPTSPVMPQGCGEMTGNLVEVSNSNCIIYSTYNQFTITNDIINITGDSLFGFIVKCSPNTQYTVSSTRTGYNCDMRIREYSQKPSDWTTDFITQSVNVGSITESVSFITNSATRYIMVCFYAANTVRVTNIMLNAGSIPLPYEPYGYKLDISSIGENLFNGDYTVAVMSVSGNTATLNTASSGRTAIVKCEPNTTYTVKKYSASNRFIIAESDIMPVNGTAMSVIQNDSSISEYSFTTSNTTQYVGIYCSTSSEQAEPQLMLNLGNTAKPYSPYNHTTTPVYLGEIESTRLVKKFVLTGNDGGAWNHNVTIRNGNGFYNPNIFTGYKANSGAGYCTHYPLSTAITDTIGVFFGGNINFITDFAEGIDTVDKWITYLQQQYAAGTPVTVWYVLNTPETAVVNEPLMKIGNYADSISGITIPVTAGGDTISVDTTLQPSGVTVNYNGWHSVQSVHEKSRNLFNYQTMAVSRSGYALTADGSESSNTQWSISDYIPINGSNFVLSKVGGNSFAICFYNTNKQYVYGQAYATGGASSKQSIICNVGTEVQYARFSYVSDTASPSYDNIASIMLNEGSTALPYEPYWT